MVGEASVALDLRPIDSFMDHYTVSTGAWLNPDKTNWGDPKVVPLPTAPTLATGADADVKERQEDDAIVFVHGWRMKESSRIAFAQTAYKRLWWSGFKGEFAYFTWPTEYVDFDAQWDPATAWAAVSDSGNFNRSEEIAWRSAPALNALLNNMRSGRNGTLNVIAHSMGNTVVSEALNLNAAHTHLVDTYILSQAAVSAHLYSGLFDPATALTEDEYAPFDGNVGSPAPRFRDLGSRAGRIINYFNEDDNALGTISWESNNLLRGSSDLVTQPSWGGVHYRYATAPSGDPVVTRVPPGGPVVALNPAVPSQLYEMLAHNLYSHSVAIGASQESFAPFTQNQDLQEFGFGSSGWDHSGQFYSYMGRRGEYWQQVVHDMNLAEA